jgi:two-component system sensor histidine kinase/response regulator
MERLTDTCIDNDGRPRQAVVAVPRASLAQRLIETLARRPGSDAELTKILLLSVGLVALFRLLAAVALARYEHLLWMFSVVPLSVDVALLIAITLTIRRTASTNHWHKYVLGFYIALIVSSTTTAIIFDEDDPLLINLMLLGLTTSLCVPWSVAWQAGLGLASLTAFTLGALTGVVVSSDLERWIILAVETALAVCFVALKGYYHRQQQLVEELRLGAESLRAENAERCRAENRLRSEVAQRELAQSLAQQRELTLRKVLEASLDAITINDGDSGRYLYVNKEFGASGYSGEEVLGKTAQELNLWAEPSLYQDFVTKLKAHGQVRNMELGLRMKTGGILDCLMSAAEVELDGRNSVVSIVRDISERKEMERNLIAARESATEASKAKSEFLSSMSHEIRTPMNAVLGMADILLETDLSKEQRRYLDVMTANGNALLELINGILDLARIESGRLQMENTEFDLTELVDKTISTFGVAAHGKGLELAARIAPGVPDRLIGDPLRLRQILVNLVGNAIKFTELGQIVLEIDRAPESKDLGELVFSVSDTGVGIRPDKLEAIFVQFTQADSSTTRKYGGTGLGLAIAQRLVGLMGGRIWVESEYQKGSKFSFEVKFGLASRLISPAADIVLSLTGYRLLVVDDSQINRMIVREMIASCGAEVSEAASGPDALSLILQARDRGESFQIILLDMRMPAMDGLEVAKRIREQDLPIKPLILMLSSDDVKPQLTRLAELGLDAYLVKPITRRELFEAIRSVLAEASHDSSDAFSKRPGLEAPKQAGTQDEPRARILIAEDAPDNRFVIEAYLRREPYQLDFVQNGKEAIAKFTTQRYSMVLMDIQMPEVDGLTATRAIRQWETDHGLARTPIVALSASVLEEDVRSALSAGCNLHIGKPVKKQILLDVIRSFSLVRTGSSDELPGGAQPPTVIAAA